MKAFTSQEDEQLLALRGSGMSFGAIADSEALPSRSADALYERHKLLMIRTARPTDASSEVACLGGCGGRFHSPDKYRIRICPNCRKRRTASGLPTHFAAALVAD